MQLSSSINLRQTRRIQRKSVRYFLQQILDNGDQCIEFTKINKSIWLPLKANCMQLPKTTAFVFYHQAILLIQTKA